jgi:hypothetical protein
VEEECTRPKRGSDVDKIRLFFANNDPVADNERYRVYLYFQYRDGWQCQFLEPDLKTSLPRKLHFASSDKVIELVERAGGFTDQDTRLMVNQAIATGRGGVFLNLTAEQYAKPN